VNVESLVLWLQMTKCQSLSNHTMLKKNNASYEIDE